MTPWMETRQKMQTNIKEKIDGILLKRQAEPPTERESVPQPKIRKDYAFCPPRIRRTTICDSCNFWRAQVQRLSYMHLRPKSIKNDIYLCLLCYRDNKKLTLKSLNNKL